MIKTISIVAFLIGSFTLSAQPGKESNYWQFGYGLSLDFSSGIPIQGTSAIHTIEGCASISDPLTGQLLFYTEGDSIWNRNNTLLPNGTGLIGGHGTSAQAALILPKPGSSDLYYVITADDGGYSFNNTGVFYSVVDMSLAGGLGDVTIKNTLLTPPLTVEKLTAVKHCNGKDYWILTHSFLTNSFHAYLLNSSGINPVPVTSNTGLMEPNTGGNFNATIGMMKASPDGKKIAYGISFYIPSIQLFNFDNSSGVVSSPVLISYSGNPGPYGLSFSPDNSKLYVALNYGQSIMQYTLAGDSTAIKASGTVVASQKYFAGMQLASNGKIYVVSSPSTLAVINAPNNNGAACNYADSAVIFTNASCKMGLPNFVDGQRYESDSKTNFDLPNIVTPNNDSINDRIDFGKYPFSTLHLEIFNRWGNRIFESDDRYCVWKPTCHDGTYYYTAQYIIGCEDKVVRHLKGFIQVIR